jgi:shikimate kinase
LTDHLIGKMLHPHLIEKHIVIGGILCSGKTSVGEKIARATKREHLDTDQLLIARLALPPQNIVNEMTRYQFQVVENKIIGDIVGLAPAVISLGSGSIGHEHKKLRSDNIQKLRNSGLLFNLVASIDVIYARYLLDINKQDLRRRDADMRERIRERMISRDYIHRSVCDFTIDTTNVTTDQVARMIVRLAEMKDHLEC